MDFPGGAITNIRVLDGFSNIYWRTYSEDPSAVTPSAEAPSNYMILKYLSRLKDLEFRLRNLDCLVSCYPRRRCLFVFSATQDFENLSPLCLERGKDLNRLMLGSTSLKISAFGCISALDLIRSLPSEPHANTVGPFGPQKSHGGPHPPRSNESYSNSAAIYTSFISAIAGAMNVQLIRRHNAIPLGMRTLFTGVNKSGYDSPTTTNDTADILPALTSLQVQLNQVGKVIVSLQTISQSGIARLCGPPGSTFDNQTQHNGDVWLAPNGTIARLVKTRVNQSTNPSPGIVSARNTDREMSQDLIDVKTRLWKFDVLEWLSNFGLPVMSVEDEKWVEVEVSEPFYARVVFETLRQNDTIQSPYPLKRIPWPARYCFKRTSASNLTFLDEMENTTRNNDDPLRFAEDWLAGAGSRKEKTASHSSTLLQSQQPKTQDSYTPKADVSENIESLARMAQYPDLQSASLVYPTPPDGALAASANNVGSSDMFSGEGSDVVMSHAPAEGIVSKHGERGSARTRSAGDNFTTFGPSRGLGVGSGLYDTNEDDDMFSEMNDKDFGSKGIGDADFSFFDEPDFESLEPEKSGADVHEYEERPEPMLISKASDLPGDSPLEKPSLDHKRPSVERTDTEPKGELAPKFIFDFSTLDSFRSKTKRRVEQASRLPATTRQTISPPLSPMEIKKILLPESFAGRSWGADEQAQRKYTASKDSRKASNYDPISFQRNVSFSDRKYGADGRYFFADQISVNNVFADDKTNSLIPIVGFPQSGRRMKSLTHDSLATVVSKERVIPDNDCTNNPRYPASVPSSDSAEDRSDAYLETSTSPTASTNLKRKRLSIDTDSTSSSLGRLSLSPDVDTTSIKEDSSLFLGTFLSTFSDWSLSGYFSIRQSRLSPVLTRKEDHIRLGQLIVDQITQSSLNHKIDGYAGLPDLQYEAFSLRTLQEDTSIIGNMEKLDLRNWVAMQDNTMIPINDSSAGRSISQRKELKGSIAKISPPYLRIHRGRDFLELLPPAISFWETFGLEPASGAKDVSAYCIHPHSTKEAADAFLDRMELLYSSCTLGRHCRGDKTKSFDNGLGSWPVTLTGDASYLSTMQSLKALCESLGNALSKVSASQCSFVIYIVNPFPYAAAVADICTAFLHLFQKYAGDTDHRQHAKKRSDIVLQVIPIYFISSLSSIVVPTQTEYVHLALEVYNRCPPRDPTLAIMGCAPPVLLAEPVSRSITFKLVPERSSPFQEGKYLHLAVSRSIDQRWVTAAWSDNSGSFQLAMSYCLRSRGSAVTRIISDVRNEIWETTKDVMEKTQTRWRILLSRDGPIDQEEIDAWALLVDKLNQGRAIPVELTILTVNIVPDFHLELPSSQFQFGSILNPQSSTPVTTPYTGMPSPDQYGTVATPTSGGNGPASASTPTEFPSSEPESDSVLIDTCDESWAVVLSHRLNNSLYMTDYRPALASGYLLRRKGVSDSDGIVAMGVNLIYTQRLPSLYEITLKEVLGMYRDLGALARVKGMFLLQRNTLPWHIATAAKGQEILSYVL